MTDIRAAIDNCDDTRVEPLDVPEWHGVEVYIRTLTAGEIADLSQHFQKDEKDIGNLARIACAGLSDADGKRLYRDNEWQRVSAKSFSAVKRIAEAVQVLNGLTEADVEDEAGN